MTQFAQWTMDNLLAYGDQHTLISSQVRNAMGNLNRKATEALDRGDDSDLIREFRRIQQSFTERHASCRAFMRVLNDGVLNGARMQNRPLPAPQPATNAYGHQDSNRVDRLQKDLDMLISGYQRVAPMLNQLEELYERSKKPTLRDAPEGELPRRERLLMPPSSSNRPAPPGTNNTHVKQWGN